MPFISKFYLLDATSPNTGTMPSNSPTTIAGGVLGTGTEAAGATTARDTSSSPGTANPDTESSITAQAAATLQRLGHRRFVSRPLAAQAFTTSDIATASWANFDSNTNHTTSASDGPRIMVYLWRPSTGARVGTAQIQLNGSTGLTTAEAANGTASPTWSANQTIQDGDILVFDVYSEFTQGMATAYTENFCYNGTTELSITTNAAFVSMGTPVQLSQVGFRAEPFRISFGKSMPSITVPNLDIQDTTPGPATYNPAVDSLYDQFVLGDLPAYGAYWKMNEKSGTTFVDRGPNNINLAALSLITANQYPGPDQGDPVLNTSPLFQSTDFFTNSKAQIGTYDFAFPGRDPFTLEIWYYPFNITSIPNANQVLFSKLSTASSHSGYILYVTTSGTLTFNRADLSGTNEQATSTATLAPDTWSHILATYDGSVSTVYLNANPVASNGSTLSMPESDSSLFSVGWADPSILGCFVNGYLAKAAVYSTSLTSTQVTEHFLAATASTWSPQTDPRVPSNLQPFGFLRGAKLLPQQFFDLVVPTFPVSQTLSIFFEGLQGIQATAVDPFEATKSLAITGSEPLEATQPIQKIGSTDVWEANQGIQKVGSVDPYDATQGIASTKSEPLEANKALSITGSEPYEATQAIQKVGSTDPVEATQGIQKVGSTDSYEALQGIQSTKAEPLEALKALSITAGEVLEALKTLQIAGNADAWEALQGIQSTNSEPYEASQKLAITGSEPYEAEQSITKSASDPLEANQGIAKNLSDPYEANQGIASTNSEPWEAEKAISQSGSEPWEANKGIQAVGNADNYESLQGISSTSSDPYESVQKLAISGVLPWEALLALSKTVVVPYEALQGIAASGTFPWEANSPANQVSQTASFPYDATQGLAISGPINYETLLNVLASSSYPWTALQGVSGSKSDPWEASKGIAASGSTQYETSQPISVSGSESWEALVGIAKSASYPFEALKSIQAASGDPLETLQLIAATSSLPLEALMLIASSSSLPWDATGIVFTTVSNTANLQLDVTSGLAISGVISIDAQKNLTIIRSQPYEGLARVPARTASLPYESLIGVTNLTELPLEVALGLVSRLHAPWEAGGKVPIVTETGLSLIGAYFAPHHVIVIQANPSHFVLYPAPSELMEGKTETGLDIGET